MKLFLQKKCKIFERWGLRPRPPCLRRLGAKTAPPLRIFGYALQAITAEPQLRGGLEGRRPPNKNFARPNPRATIGENIGRHK